MVEQALEEHAEREAAASPAAVVLSPGSGALMLLRLQQSAGNAAVARLVTRSADGHAARAHSLARCAGGTCTCGGTCRGSDDVEEDELAAFALARAVAGRRVVARQHQPGGPYHPPAGTEMRCTMDDDCSTLSTKINYLRHTIESHQAWDAANPNPAYPGGRHAAEIADLQRALENCKRIANLRCTGQPVWVPAEQPAENPQERLERVKRELYEALPYAVAIVVIAAVAACILAEPCGVAVAGVLAAILGEEALATVLAILAANGVRWATQ